VPVCPDGHRLAAANNIWTVAKNLRGDMPDLIPVLITRNVEASSLAAKVGEQDLKEKTVRFDPGDARFLRFGLLSGGGGATL